MKYRSSVFQSLAMVTQFGINMLVPIVICSFIGIFIDKKCGTSFFVIILFFVGAAAGFRNVFHFAKKIYNEPAKTREHYKADSDEAETIDAEGAPDESGSKEKN